MREAEYPPREEDQLGDWEGKVERRRPRRAPSAVFSVRFGRNEIAAVRRAAAKAGERTSEFIRISALTRARGGQRISLDMVPSTGAAQAALSTPEANTYAVSDYNYALVA